MRKTILLVIMTTAIIFSACTGRQAKEKEKALDTIPIMVMQIQKCSRLYTAEAQVHRIITHDDQLRLKGSILKNEFDISLPGGKRKVAIPMDATLKAYIDFKGFNEKNVRRQGEKIEIILPDPKVVLTSSKIDHEGIKKFVSLTRSNFSDEELSSYEQEGRKGIINDIPRMDILETARQSARTPWYPCSSTWDSKPRTSRLVSERSLPHPIFQASSTAHRLRTSKVLQI